MCGAAIRWIGPSCCFVVVGRDCADDEAEVDLQLINGQPSGATWPQPSNPKHPCSLLLSTCMWYVCTAGRGGCSPTFPYKEPLFVGFSAGLDLAIPGEKKRMRFSAEAQSGPQNGIAPPAHPLQMATYCLHVPDKRGCRAQSPSNSFAAVVARLPVEGVGHRAHKCSVEVHERSCLHAAF